MSDLRKQSAIINIRLFHNFIKRTLINETVELLKNGYNCHNIKLLDLAVGKGGDLNKWIDNHISHVIGFDIEKDSIYGPDGAIARFNKIRNKNRYDYKFYVTDLSKKENLNFIKNKIGNMKFNIVSCQFAIHYFFEKEEYLENLIHIVSTYLDNNGFFIGTTMDGDKINKLIMEKGDLIDNDTYYLESKTDITSTYQPYGNTYLVSLGKQSEKKNIIFQIKYQKNIWLV